MKRLLRGWNPGQEDFRITWRENPFVRRRSPGGFCHKVSFTEDCYVLGLEEAKGPSNDDIKIMQLQDQDRWIKNAGVTSLVVLAANDGQGHSKPHEVIKGLHGKARYIFRFLICFFDRVLHRVFWVSK